MAQQEFETEHRRVVLLDAPGHKDFIPNMITGAAQVSLNPLGPRGQIWDTSFRG